MNRVLIVTGGTVNDEFLTELIFKTEFTSIIAVDGGLKVLYRNNLKPDAIVGDFDTIEPEILSKYKYSPTTEVVSLNPEKDYTDTQSALEYALKSKPDEIFIIGGIGSRIDHSLANIAILEVAMEANVRAFIVNENNKIRMICGNVMIDKKDLYGPYISLLPFGGEAKGVTLKGFKYNLDNFDFVTSKVASLGISNEMVEDKAFINIQNGRMLLIEARD